MRFEIFSLGFGEGELGLCAAPGSTGQYRVDLGVILAWKPEMIISMTQQHELDELGAVSFFTDLLSAGITVVHLPTPDLSVPEAAVIAKWPNVSVAARGILRTGGRVLVHCRGGCGRSGMATLKLMVEAGRSPDIALKELRSTRPCAVETNAQMKWATGSTTLSQEAAAGTTASHDPVDK
ncbi:protein-tyrosine phosphatase family protein [Pseudopelagicola sp. nBUS_20]|uniref:protein-tyrosine phosphatase family protein n=1 Tax=Pseudopelagicola sp. nBUS_20 TaxID=3395317 RepID=UPI003EBDF75D